MKKLAKKLLCLTAVLALTLSLFTGCKSKNEKTLFEYAGQEVTFQEAHVYARIMQYQAEAQYGAYFGDSMWSMQVGTDSKGKKITMQQSVKDSVINQLKQIKVLAAHADDYNVKLTKSEKKQIKESVTAFAKDSTGKKVMKKTEADKDMIQKLYEESTIASKVMQAIIKKANVTVTDDEAKTVKVYKLVFTTKTTDSKTGKEKDMTAAEKKDQLKKAKSALKMIKKGQSISSVAKKFSVNSDNEESYTKGKATLGTKFETAAAKLMRKDKFFYPKTNIYDLPLYGNQFIPLGIKTTGQERVRIASEFDGYCSGGSILHYNIDAPFDSFEKAWKMTNYIADQGVTYFAFNTKIQACQHNHAFYGTKCPVCGEPVDTEFTRIVGFYTPVKTYSKERKAEFEMRKWGDINAEAEEI